VTGAAKARIVSRATCMGRVPLEELTMKPRLSRGFFLAEDRCVMHKVEALIWAAIFAVARRTSLPPSAFMATTPRSRCWPR
jgi:hypothetical protein